MSETALLSTLAMWAGARAAEQGRAATAREMGVAERPLSGFDQDGPEPFALSPGMSRRSSQQPSSGSRHLDPLSLSGGFSGGMPRVLSRDSLASPGMMSGRSTPGLRSRRESSAWELSGRLDSLDRVMSPTSLQWDGAISPVRRRNSNPPWFETTAPLEFSARAAAAPFAAAPDLPDGDALGYDGDDTDDPLATPVAEEDADEPPRAGNTPPGTLAPRLHAIQRTRSLANAANTPSRGVRGVVPDDFSSWADGATGGTGTDNAAAAGRNLPPRRGKRSSLAPVVLADGAPAAPSADASSELPGGAGRPAAIAVPEHSSQDTSLAPSPHGLGDHRPPKLLTPAVAPIRAEPAAPAPAAPLDSQLSFHTTLTGPTGSNTAGAGSPLGARWARAGTEDIGDLPPPAAASPGGRTPPLAPRPATLDPGSRRWSGSDLDPGAASPFGGPGATPDGMTDSLRSTSVRHSIFFSGSEFDAAPTTSCHQHPFDVPNLSVIGTPAEDGSLSITREDIAAVPRRRDVSSSAPSIPCTSRPSAPAAIPLPPAFPAAHHAPIPTAATGGASASQEAIASPADASPEERRTAGLSHALLEAYDDIETRSASSAGDIDATLRFRARSRITGRRVTVIRRSVRNSPAGDGHSDRTGPLSSTVASCALAEAYRHITLSACGPPGGSGFDTSGLFLMLDAFVDADPAGRAVFLYTVFEEHPRHWVPAAPPAGSASTTSPASSLDGAACADPAIGLGDCDGRCKFHTLAAASHKDAAASASAVLVRLDEFAKLLWGGCPAHSLAALQPAQTALVVRWLLLSLSNALITMHRERLRHGAVASDVYVVANSAVTMEHACAQLRDGDEEAILSLQVKLGPPALECTSRATLRHKPTTDLQDAAVTIIRAVAQGLGTSSTAPLEAQALAVGRALGSPTYRVLQLLLSVATNPMSHSAVSVAAAADLAVDDAPPGMTIAELQATLPQQLRIASGGLPMLGIDASGTIRYASSSSERMLGTALVSAGRPPLHAETLLQTGLVGIDDTWLERFTALAKARAPQEVPPVIAVPPFEVCGAWNEPPGPGVVTVSMPTADGRHRRVQVEVCVLPDNIACSVQLELQVDIRALVWLRDCSVEAGVEILHTLASRHAVIASYIPQPVLTVAAEDPRAVVAMSDAAARLFFPRRPTASHAGATAQRPIVRLPKLFPGPVPDVVVSPRTSTASAGSDGSARTSLRARACTTLCSTADGRVAFPAHVASIGQRIYITHVACETDDMFAAPAFPSVAASAFASWLRGLECGSRPRPEIDAVLPHALVGAATTVVVNAWGLCVNILHDAASLAAAGVGTPAAAHVNGSARSTPSRRGTAHGASLPGLALRRPVWDCFDEGTAAELRDTLEAAKGCGDMMSPSHGGRAGRSFFVAGAVAGAANGVSTGSFGDSAVSPTLTSEHPHEDRASPPMGAERAATLPPPVSPDSEPRDGNNVADAVEVSSFGGDDEDEQRSPKHLTTTARPSVHALQAKADMGEVAVYVEPRISATEHLFLLCICTRVQGSRLLAALC